MPSAQAIKISRSLTKKLNIYHLICFLAFFMVATQLSGQFRDQPPGRGSNIDTTFANSSDWTKIDSIRLFYSYADRPDTRYQQSRDTMEFQFHQYDPTRKQDLFYRNLGNVGSAAKSHLFKGYEQKGVHSGIHQYDLYLVNVENFKFYDTDIPLSDFYISQGALQEDGLIEARFGRNFTKGFKLSLLYSRINQLGAYLDQRTKNTNFGFGVQVDSENERYDGYYGYISNSVVQENNGGITSYDSLSSPFRQIRRSIEVNLEDALSTLRERNFFSTHYFHILTKGDSTKKRRSILDIKYAVQFTDYFYKFADENISNSIPYYGEFVTDERGMRHFIGYQKLINEIGFSFNLNPENSIFGSLEHRLVTLNQEPIEEKRNEVYLNGEIQSKIFRRFNFHGIGYLGILDASANFNLEGIASLDLNKYGTFKGKLRIHQRRPDLIEESLFVNQIPVWQEDYKNINTNVIEVAYENTGLNVEAALRWWLVDNYIYYGPDFKPIQLDNSISIQQFYAKGSYQFSIFQVAGIIGLQNFDANELAMPNLILEGTAAISGRIFRKKLKYQLGADLRFTDDYSGVGYFPLTGQFYNETSRMIYAYPSIDPFIALQIGSLKVYLKWENINSNWSKEFYDHVVGYPQYETYFRFGMGFQLYN